MLIKTKGALIEGEQNLNGLEILTIHMHFFCSKVKKILQTIVILTYKEIFLVKGDVIWAKLLVSSAISAAHAKPLQMPFLR